MQGGSSPHPAGRGLSDRNRIVGPGAAALKYDILTALLALAAQGAPVEARLSLRLSLLITARFNWQSGRFAVGLREMARMWGVTERTAKREISALKARGWITLAVPSARGRVAAYQIELPVVLQATMGVWAAVGPDFAARMVGAPEPETDSNVVPLRGPDVGLPAPDGTGWAAAAAILQAQEPSVYSAWFAPLHVVEADAGLLTLAAPSRFVADYVSTHFRARLLAAVVQANPGIRDISICVAPGA